VLLLGCKFPLIFPGEIEKAPLATAPFVLLGEIETVLQDEPGRPGSTNVMFCLGAQRQFVNLLQNAPSINSWIAWESSIVIHEGEPNQGLYANGLYANNGGKPHFPTQAIDGARIAAPRLGPSNVNSADP